MGNLNFQEGQNENPEQDPNQNQGPNQPEENERNLRADEGYIDDPTSGSSKFLWIAIVVVLIAGIGGALYMLNRAGYLKFLNKKKPVITTITTPAPAATAPATVTSMMKAAAKPTPAPQGSFALQVAAFTNRQQANRFVSSMSKKGIDSYVAESLAGGKRWYRVCTGSFDTKLKAIAAIHNMKQKVGTDVWVVPAQ